MATTKFLDYTGLSKLVEKIKNTYVNKNEQYEANLKWGGKNFADSFGPIDAAMIPELGANRFAFGNPKGITIEYSNDGGSTWKDYGASDATKLQLTSTGANFIVGKVKSQTPANDMLRVTIDTSSSTGINSYSVLNKFGINVSTQGSQGTYCTIQKALQSTPTVFTDVVTKVPISGWSGYNIINTDNIITYGDAPTIQYGRLRFIFGNTGNTTDYPGMAVHKICAFGGEGWFVPSNMAKNGHLYTYDYNKNATFPANVTATKFNGSLNGNASSATKATKDSDGNQINTTYASMMSGNEFNFIGKYGWQESQSIAINYRKPDRTYVETAITSYYFYNGQGKTTGVNVFAENFEGKINGYTVSSNVPSNAKFTDTTYTDLKGATTSANGTHGLVPAPTKSDVGKFLKGDGTWGTPTAPTLPTDAVENIIGGSTDSYSGFLDGDGLKIVMEAVKTLIGVVDIPYYSVEIMNFSGNVERVAIKMSNEFAQAQFFDNLYNLKFIKFGDGCVFTRIGQTLNQGNPVFKGTVVDQMQGIDDMVAWISTDGSNTYLIFDDANNTVASGALDDSYTPTPLETKLTWGN